MAKIKLRRDTAANWSNLANNPILASGEPGYETDTGRLKFGDGSTAWNSLPYFDDQETVLSAVTQSIIPDEDNTYDLGSPSKQWRDLYVSNGSIYIGDVKLTNDNGTLLVQQVTDPGLDTEEPVPDAPGVVTTDRLVNGENSFVLSSNGIVELNGDPFTGGVTGITTEITPMANPGEETFNVTLNSDGAGNTVSIRIYARDNAGAGDPNPGFAIGRDLGGEHANNAIAIGNDDVGYDQGENSIAIGHKAGWADDSGIGANAIAIGHKAAYNSAPANSITLNATGQNLDPDEAGLFVKPIREEQYDDQILFYNPNSGEVTYAANTFGGVPELTDDHEIKITVGNTEYFAIVNRANNDDNGVKASGVAYDSSGNMITLHVSEVNIGETNIDRLIISKFDDVGALLWQKQIQEDIDVENDHDLLIDADDNIIVAVSKDYDEASDSIVLIKFNAAGEVLWQKEYISNVETDSSLEVTAISLSGTDIVVAGEYIPNTDNSEDYGFVMKVNATGELQWARTFAVDAPTTPYGMDVDSYGDVVVVGVAEPDGLPGAAFAQKFDGDTGAAAWTKILFGPEAGNNNQYAGGDVVVDSQNNIFITVNSSQDIVHNDSDNTTVTISHVMKLDENGQTQWCRRIGPGPCASVATGIDCDDTGNVYMSAVTVAQKNPVRDLAEYYNDSTKNVLAVVKYSTAGAVLWQRYIESDYYNFYPNTDGENIGLYDSTTSRGRNMSIGPNGKLAIQVAATQRDPDDYQENSRYWESITFQIDQDGREMTVGSGNERFTVKASRIPGKFVTIEDIFDEGGFSTEFTENVTVSTATLTFGDAELAQQVAQSAPYEYVFGNDGTLTIPNDGDVKLTQTQVGWFSIFGPANNSNDDIWIRANCVDPDSGDVYVVGQEDYDNRGFVARYNSQGQIQWSIRLYDDDDGNNTRCNAVKIHPTTGNVVVLCEYFGNQTGVLIVQIDPDTARVESSVGFRDFGVDDGVNAYDLAFLSGSDVVVVGRKYDEWKATPITPDPISSTTGVIRTATSSLPTGIDPDWRISGTGLEGRVQFGVDQYYGLTGTVREGSGAQFQVVSTGGGDPYASALATVPNKGSNYLVGHKIKILGTDLGGVTPANDAIITVTEVGEGGSIEAVTVSGTAGPTYTINSITDSLISRSYLIMYDSNTGWTSADLSGYTLTGPGGYSGTVTGASQDQGGGQWHIPVSPNIDQELGNYVFTSNDEGGTYNSLTGTNYNVGSGYAVSVVLSSGSNLYEEMANLIGDPTGGSNYVAGDVITIPGTSLDGAAPTNDLTVTVVTVDGGGAITGTTFSGTRQTTVTKISIDAAVDFSGEGSWSFQQPLGGEAFVVRGSAGEFDLAWTKVLSAGGEWDTERYLSVAVDGSDNIYAAGEMIGRNGASGGDLDSYWCAVVSKFSSDGTHLWTKTLNDELNDCYAKSVAVQGNSIIVTHENNSSGTTVVTKLDGTGTIKWQRRTYTGDDSSAAVDTNGDVYVIAEAYMESDYGNCVKVIRFNSAGEIIWRKILATQLRGNNNTSEYFKNGRNLTIDDTHLYISGYTTAYDNNYDSGFTVKIPKSGDQDGVYSVWVIQQDTYDVDKVNATEATAFTPNIGNGEWSLWTPDFASQWWDPSDNDYYHTLTEMRDRDGGAIEFADGTRQTSSAQQIPQIKISNGADHRLCSDDMGKHIYVTDSYTNIAVPYHETDPLPVGYTVVVINNSGSSISIDADGSGIDIIVPGVDSSQYWDLDSPGMATLIKVEESVWMMTGNVTVD